MNPESNDTPEHNRSNSEAWIEREPATQPTAPQEPVFAPQNQNPYATIATPPVPLQQPPKPHKKHSRLFVFGLIFAAFLVVFGVVFAAVYLANNSHPVKKVAEKSTPTVAANALQTYLDPTKKTAEIYQDDKAVATVEMPDKKSEFSVVAASDKVVLLLAKKSAGDKDPIGHLVSADGEDSALTGSIAATVAGSSTKAHALGFLDQQNNFLSVSCKNTSCALNSTDLKSGETTALFTQGYTPPDKAPANSTSIALLGISSTNVAFITTYSGSNSTDPVGTVIAIDLTTGSTKKSLIMPQAAAKTAQFSPDFANALFTQSQDSATGNLINWQSGATQKVVGSIGNGDSYLWSPDSKRALALNNPRSQTSTLLLIPVETARQTTLKTFPTSGKLSLKVLGWTNNSVIQYALTPDGGATAIHTFNVDSGEDKVLPSTDLILLPVTDTVLTSN